MSTDLPPTDEPGFDLYADQRGRLIGTLTAVTTLTTTFVFLRLLSRKLSRAGYWVRFELYLFLQCRMQKPGADRFFLTSGMISSPSWP